MARNEPEPFQAQCPLCDHDVQVAEGGDMCQFCGAQLELFRDETTANQFVETCKSRGESARWRQTLYDGYWIVGHKSSPDQEVFRLAG